MIYWLQNRCSIAKVLGRQRVRRRGVLRSHIPVCLCEAARALSILRRYAMSLTCTCLHFPLYAPRFPPFCATFSFTPAFPKGGCALSRAYLHSTPACMCYIFIYPRFPEGRLRSAASLRALLTLSSKRARKARLRPGLAGRFERPAVLCPRSRDSYANFTDRPPKIAYTIVTLKESVESLPVLGCWEEQCSPSPMY